MPLSPAQIERNRKAAQARWGKIQVDSEKPKVPWGKNRKPTGNPPSRPRKKVTKKKPGRPKKKKSVDRQPKKRPVGRPKKKMAPKDSGAKGAAARWDGHTAKSRAQQLRTTSAAQAEKIRKFRDIGDIPDIVDPARRERTRYDFLAYLTTYEAVRYTLSFSKHHLWLIRAAQQAILEGIQKLAVFPRGSGKTSIFRDAVKWATLHGHRRFPMLIGAEDSKARQHLISIRRDLLGIGLSRLLLEDFPEVIYPIHRTEGISLKAIHQLCRDRPTEVSISEHIIFPTVAESIERGNAGAVISTGTMTSSALRGALIHDIRPDVAFVDDPQTRASAKSPTQCDERLEILQGDILAMAGPDKPQISVLVTGTPIYREDMIDRLCNPEEFPEWGALKVRMLITEPTNKGLWDQWNDIRKQCFLEIAAVVNSDEDPDPTIEVGSFLAPAHDFYRAHRDKMDAGASVYWEDRILPGYVSAIETAMFYYYRNPRVFAAEYQVTPIDIYTEEEGFPSASILQKKMSGYPPRVAPSTVEHLTVGIDVQRKILYWTVCGFTPDFTCHVLDYGAFPDQKREHFSLSDVRRTIFNVTPGISYAGALHRALMLLLDQIESTPWRREDGSLLKISRALIDAQYAESTDTVYDVCHTRGPQTPFAPVFAIYLRGTSQPFHKQGGTRGAMMGLQWKIPARDPKRPIRHTVFDINWWKTFVCGSVKLPIGAPGGFSFPKRRTGHAMFAEHMNSQYPSKVEARGREFTEWSRKPGEPDDHFLLCLVYCYLAASISGAKPAGVDSTIIGAGRKKRTITHASLERKRA